MNAKQARSVCSGSRRSNTKEREDKYRRKTDRVLREIEEAAACGRRSLLYSVDTGVHANHWSDRTINAVMGRLSKMGYKARFVPDGIQGGQANDDAIRVSW